MKFHVRIISANSLSIGSGEAGFPAIAPMIGNAVAQLIGKRLCHFSMSSDRVKKALA